MDNDSEEILGIDYGEKRIGISISMLNKKIAIPHSIIEYTNKEKAIDEINEIVAKNKIKLIVLGIPKTLKNNLIFYIGNNSRIFMILIPLNCLTLFVSHTCI